MVRAKCGKGASNDRDTVVVSALTSLLPGWILYADAWEVSVYQNAVCSLRITSLLDLECVLLACALPSTIFGFICF